MSRRLAFLVVLALLAPASAALAAPRRGYRPQRVCQLVVDPSGDATAAPMKLADSPTGNEPAYDIVSADIAADDQTVTAVVRVADLAAATANAPAGLHWRLDFHVSGSTTGLYLQAFSTPFGERFDLGYVDGTTSNTFRNVVATGVIDLWRDEVRISAPTLAVRPEAYLVPGATITDIRASAGRFYSMAGRHPSISEHTDEAATDRTYRVGAPSCVTPGG